MGAFAAAGRPPARLLALDAAGRSCSAAVWAEGRIRAQRLERMARGQSERLVPLAQAVMAEAGLDFAALEAIAVTLGPGGFTGVRIGLAAAEGLALAWDLPIVGLSNFAVVAAAVPSAERQGRNLLVAIDAKRPELYAAAWDREGREILAPALLPPAELAAGLPAEAPLLIAGDAAPQAAAALEAAGRTVLVSAAPGEADAAWLARLAAAEPLPAERRLPQPLYLRPPDTTQPRARALPGRPQADQGS